MTRQPTSCCLTGLGVVRPDPQSPGLNLLLRTTPPRSQSSVGQFHFWKQHGLVTRDKDFLSQRPCIWIHPGHFQCLLMGLKSLPIPAGLSYITSPWVAGTHGRTEVIFPLSLCSFRNTFCVPTMPFMASEQMPTTPFLLKDWFGWKRVL